jgi:hypothetical protein
MINNKNNVLKLPLIFIIFNFSIDNKILLFIRYSLSFQKLFLSGPERVKEDKETLAVIVG